MNPEMNAAIGIAGAVVTLGLSAFGSAFGTGRAAAAAIGAWKKCYAQGKPAPFILLSYIGAPITQTLYGMILMFEMINAATSETALPGSGVGLLILGPARASPTPCPRSVSLRPRPSSAWSSPTWPSATSTKLRLPATRLIGRQVSCRPFFFFYAPVQAAAPESLASLE